MSIIKKRLFYFSATIKENSLVLSDFKLAGGEVDKYTALKLQKKYLNEGKEEFYRKSFSQDTKGSKFNNGKS